MRLWGIVVVFAGGLLASCSSGVGDHSAPPSDASSAHDAAASDAGVATASDAMSEAAAEIVPITDDMRALALPAVATTPADISNRFADDPAAAAFGRLLFFDASFSGRLLDGDNDGSAHALGTRGQTGKVACSGCHLPASDFSDTRSIRQQISLAAGWGKRRAPSLLDVAQSKLLMWDGRRDSFQNQIFGVIESPVEMNSSRLFAAQQVFALHRSAYEALFGALPPLNDAARFPQLTAETTGCSQLDQNLRVCKGESHGIPGDNAEYDGMSSADQDAVTAVIINLGKALGSYQRLLTCGESRFDRWVRGQDPNALTPSEQRGAALFVGKAKCAQCHSGPYLSDEKFHNVGLKPAVVGTVFIDADDPGASAGLLAAQQDPLNVAGHFSDGDDKRLPAVLGPALVGAFRTPKLRCISKRPSFMHTAQIKTLADVITFFNRGGDSVGFPGTSEIKALGLSTDEQGDLAAFLLALDGPGPDATLRAP